MKHLKKNLRVILAVTAMVAVLVATAAVASAATKRTIEANYMGIKLIIDGVEVVPKDAAGNVVEPFTSNGTTYLPVRALAQALGKEVEWDASTNTIYIGDTVHLPYQVNHATLFDGSDPNASFSVAGKVYKVGVVLHSFHSTNGFHPDPYDGSAVWNTEGKQTMTFTVGHVGSLQRNGTLYVALDGRAAGEYPLRWDGSPQTIDVSLGGSPNVKLTLVTEEMDGTGFSIVNLEESQESYAVYDVSLS